MTDVQRTPKAVKQTLSQVFQQYPIFANLSTSSHISPEVRTCAEAIIDALYPERFLDLSKMALMDRAQSEPFAGARIKFGLFHQTTADKNIYAIFLRELVSSVIKKAEGNNFTVEALAQATLAALKAKVPETDSPLLRYAVEEFLNRCTTIAATLQKPGTSFVPIAAVG